MATHSSILAWRIPWTEELGGLQSTGRKESYTTERLHFTFFHLKHKIESYHFSGNPTPCFYLGKVLIQKGTCTPIFRAALFTTARTALTKISMDK